MEKRALFVLTLLKNPGFDEQSSMRLGEIILRCYECVETASYEEVESVTRNGIEVKI